VTPIHPYSTDDEIDARYIRRQERRRNREKARDMNEIDEANLTGAAGDVESPLNATPLSPPFTKGGEKPGKRPKANDLDEAGPGSSRLKSEDVVSMEQANERFPSLPALEERQDIRFRKHKDGKGEYDVAPLETLTRC
jgi:hypothetical protein